MQMSGASDLLGHEIDSLRQNVVSVKLLSTLLKAHDQKFCTLFQLVSAGFILLEKKVIGFHSSLICYYSTAPMAVSEASVMMMFMGASA